MHSLHKANADTRASLLLCTYKLKRENEARVRELAAQVQVKEAQARSAQMTEERTQELVARVRRVEDEVIQARGLASERGFEVARMQAELAAVQCGRGEASGRMQQVEAKAREVGGEVREALELVGDVRVGLEALWCAHEEVEEELGKRGEQVAQLACVQRELEGACSDLRGQLRASRERETAGEVELGDMRERCERLREMVAEAEDKLAREQERRREEKTEMETAFAHKTKGLQEQLASAGDAVVRMEQEMMPLKTKVEELEEMQAALARSKETLLQRETEHEQRAASDEEALAQVAAKVKGLEKELEECEAEGRRREGRNAAVIAALERSVEEARKAPLDAACLQVRGRVEDEATQVDAAAAREQQLLHQVAQLKVAVSELIASKCEQSMQLRQCAELAGAQLRLLKQIGTECAAVQAEVRSEAVQLRSESRAMHLDDLSLLAIHRREHSDLRRRLVESRAALVAAQQELAAREAELQRERLELVQVVAEVVALVVDVL